jgi:Ran GTPase-activating protein (RanGAP) involved in mRNA processing and transport
MRNSLVGSFDLSHNHASNSGCFAIAELLQKNSCLKNLDLSANYIGDDGCCALAESLELNYSLHL